MKYFSKKRVSLIGWIALFIAIICMSNAILDIEPLEIFTSFGKSVRRFFQIYFPMDFSDITDLLYQLWVTVVISIAGAFVGTILAFFSALATSSSTGNNKFFKTFFRFLASLARNIPEAVWAIILIPCLWYGEFLGFIVMCIIAYGLLVRAFSDTIDETNKNAIEALQATGASYWQIIFHAVVPETLPSLISWTLYAAENNIRSATVVGMLAGGGIGYAIGIYKSFLNYTSLSTCILLVIIVVVASDQISSAIRRRIL